MSASRRRKTVKAVPPRSRRTAIKKGWYLTTPLYYVNDVPHLGHAYTTVAADVLARYHRLRGERVLFVTGTDEHGQKVAKAAAEHGLAPLLYADQVVERFRTLWSRLGISHDDFIRTTETRHTQVVQAVLTTLHRAGEIYTATYQGWYCLFCERFWTEKDLVPATGSTERGGCPDCRRRVEPLSETNYFFKMGRHRDWLRRYIQAHPGFIQPASRRREVLGFLGRPLEDLCISRPVARLAWGIPMPFDPQYVTYVWFDALLNYLTAAGYPDGRWRQWWPADLHLVGKDILTTHSVYWATMLHALDLPLPRTIFAHGWWTVEGEKMSKSRGNVVDPAAAIVRLGSASSLAPVAKHSDSLAADALRYFLLREVPFGHDGDFSEAALTRRVNSDLANGLGNLVSRTLTMVERYADGTVPAPPRTTPATSPLRQQTKRLFTQMAPLMASLEFNKALVLIWNVIESGNRYIETKRPWDLAKQPSSHAALDTVLYQAAETLRLLSLALAPFMPETAATITRQLGWPGLAATAPLRNETRWGRLRPGTKIEKGPVLFPRLERSEASRPSSPDPHPAPLTGRERKKGTDAGHPLTPPETTMIMPEVTPEVTINEFRRLELRIGRIVAAERISGSTKLLKLTVSLGQTQRQMVAGVASRYTPEELVGVQVVCVVNLKPAKIFGVESQGMVLAAGDEAVDALTTVKSPVQDGTRVK